MPNRAWLYWAVVVLSGPLVLAILEGGLRLLPGLEGEPLVRRLAEHDGHQLKSINALYPQRFFFERYKGKLAAQGRMLARPFVEPSVPRPYRIIFLGASTVQGFPHPARLASASFLEAMMQDVAEDQQVQVFNLGITSIASFAVARTLEEAIVLRPDLAIVYTGHNEFFGIYGGSQQAYPYFNYVHYNLLKLHLGQLLRRGLDGLRGQQTADESLLAIRSGQGLFPHGGKARKNALSHLRHNLQTMAEVCRERGVPLVLCTIASNDAGFAPVATLSGRGNSEEEQLTQIAAYLAGEKKPIPQTNQVLGELEQFAEEFPQDAWVHYLRGRALTELGRDEAAVQALLSARDFDAMPWRGPSGHNLIIRQVADEEGLLLADIERAFAHAAPSDGVGWDLMADHVHPSVLGQELLARTILLAVKDTVGPLDLGRLRGANEYRELLGDLPAERVRVEQIKSGILGEKPMDRYNTHKFQYFKDQTAQRLQQLEEAEISGLKKWGQKSAEVPLALEIADLFFAEGNFVRALPYYKAASREAPFTPRGDLWAVVQAAWSVQLSGGEFTQEQRSVMRQALSRAEFLVQAPDMKKTYIDFIRGQLHFFLQESDRALNYLEPAFLDEQFRRPFLYTLFPPLATELVRAGRREDARRYAQWASAESNGNPYFIQFVERLIP
ncbi:MAG: hypothetical protein GKR89_21290 [Candidatus Latescibacteria bacterium]|nr:hypothetical protein [Candidatus Latescibacterota bacterium]